MRRRLAVALLAPTLLVALAASRPTAAAAQLSPGALARPHAALEGALQCTKCHGGRKESTAARCLACHREIGWLAARGRGLHARDAKGECASCHPEHAGRGFALIVWPERMGGSPSRFEHARAGWALEGSHAEAKCEACHTTKYRVSPAARLSPRRASAGWVGLERACTSCHEDVHRGTLDDARGAPRCEGCHDAGEWAPAPRFDHARTDYPLTGAHADVACDGCHLAPRLRPARDADGEPIPVFRPVPARDCSSCHADPHQGRLTGACSGCHQTAAWRTVARGRFDHDRTRYPLRGAHADAECRSCHGSGGRRVARPAFASCGGCHADPHRGEGAVAGRPADCAACHRVEGWTPSTFTVERHAESRYPLEGKHREVACGDCHAPRPGAPRARGDIVMRPAHASCADCHADPHEWRAAGGGRVDARACGACHDARAFRPSTVDVAAHARLGWALEGAHRAVPCGDCHRALAGRPAPPAAARGALVGRTPAARLTIAEPRRDGCRGCHEDPHGGQFDRRRGGGACERCHEVAAFAPASRFDHARDTRFPLDGGHTGVACASCHRAGAAARAGVVYAISTTCESCHAASPALTPRGTP
jgi:hypothetical protein